ncbi:hypothetical protein ABZ490_18080 [Streptomyces sp. NPDC005811]
MVAVTAGDSEAVRAGPFGPGFAHDHRVSVHGDYRWRHRPEKT